MITQLGDAFFAMRGIASTASITHMAIGSGTGQTSGSTTLATETARVALTSIAQGTGAADNTILAVAVFPLGTGDGVFSEVGLFTASSGGTMVVYTTTFAALYKDDSVTVNITFRIGAS